MPPVLQGIFGDSSRVEVLLFLESQESVPDARPAEQVDLRMGNLNNHRGRY
jgi:hypothetical protein